MAKSGLRIIPLILCLSACSSSISPSFLKEDAPQAVQDICKKEYQLDVSSKLVGNTLWVYLPLDNMLSWDDSQKSPTQQIFLVEEKQNIFDQRILKTNYYVKLAKDKAEEKQGPGLDKSVNEKIFKILQVIRRVLFSIDHAKKDLPQFFCIVTADIKNGFEIKQVFYLPDLKKISYGIISQTEYQHRIVQDSAASLLIIADKAGAHLDYRDITLEGFIADQIRCRIRLKFQKPEVTRDADIDKEVLKITAYTLGIYEFKDFNFVEMNNLAANSKIILNQSAILANSKE